MRKPKLAEYAQFAEIVASIGVVVSLIFVGIEVNENTRVARSELTKDLLLETHEVGIQMIANPALQEAFLDLTGLNMDADEAARYSLFLSRFRMFELIFNLKDEGLIDEDVWHSYEAVIHGWLKAPKVQRLWDSNEYIFEPRFRSYINALRQAS